MSEKKYIFKIAKGEPIDPKLTKEKIYRIKLAAEDSQGSKQEVILDEPYFIKYKLSNNEDCSLVCSPVNSLIDNIDNTKAKSFCSDDYPCIDNNGVFNTVKIIQSGDNKYQLMVNNRSDISALSDKLSILYESFLLPNPSLEFLVNDSTLKEYYDRQSNTGEMQLTVSGRGDQTSHSGLLIKDLSGNIVCKVHSNMLVVTEEAKLAEYLGELLQKDYEYVTVATSNKIKNYDDLVIYISDRDGNPIADTGNVNVQLSNMLKNSNLYNSVTFQQISKYILENPTNDQLPALAEHLTDDELLALAQHFSNEQLQTLAQELNETKLKIIVPVLNEDQLEILVRELKPDQVKNILSCLKTDQFKALIKSIDDNQFVELAKDLAEHRLTILSKELGDDQLRTLVNNLEGDKLKDLVNKLDHDKLAVIAQDLTDPGRIEIMIDHLSTNPEKLQTFANEMSDQQFAEFLNKPNTEKLKDIIHKLPHGKVIPVIDDFCKNNQFRNVLDTIKGRLENQNKQATEVIEVLKQIKEDMPEIAQAPDLTVVDSSKNSMLFV